ncbi:hypothetical protein BCR32DRAFT_248079 [Anaeromyces robustus]|uniref:Uncharacterized protein n=1 Tax=Anaeromyces robustus TaxID=1754192 RepID=A0A1Y1WUQ1_9FUNG|nr:hypothetical protein BCR32DRAFT_248079 [Anaeromyces robustus]|eukprot:ORX77281.1 hypothetical protein BCR32DRAFT_248079 [Anaeromyces robustus]
MTIPELKKSNFKNENVLLIVSRASALFLKQENEFLSLVENYNSKVKNSKEEFKIFTYEYEENKNEKTMEIEICDKNDLEKRKEKFIKDMVYLYKNVNGIEDEKNKDVVTFTKILKFIGQSKLLISKNYDIESKIKEKYNPLDKGKKLLLPPDILCCYAEFLIFLKKLFDGNSRNKKYIVKYIIEVVKEINKVDKLSWEIYRKTNDIFSYFLSSQRDYHWKHRIYTNIGRREGFANVLKSLNILKRTKFDLELVDLCKKVF